MREATVLIPTFDHGRLIRHALGSAQAQTLRDIEIFVVGDGAPAETRETVERAAAQDPRIRYFENPKGERLGERWRHEALAEASGRIVCYLADDDLWFPDHVETMAGLLADADFAGALQGRAYPDGRLYGQCSNFALPQYRNPNAAIGSKLGISGGAHTLAFYRRLPKGWQPAPADVRSDQHMWQQFFATPGCRAVSSFRPTCMTFISELRRHMSPEERERELESWWARIADPTRQQRLREEILAAHLENATSDANGYAEQLDRLGNRKLAATARPPFASIEATVVIPTHDHGPLLRYSLASAQAQTVPNIEIFVIGDGAPPVTREIVETAAAADPRVRYFEHPKGERHGERYRHRALAEARGRIVCYLGDDDLWFPDHVAEMAKLLTEADFAGGLQGWCDLDGRIYGQVCNLALRQYRSPKTAMGIKMGLSSGAHTMALYRRLPEGWRPAPPDIYTDKYMWMQILSLPRCLAVSSVHPTGLGFSSGMRAKMLLSEREREMSGWWAAIQDSERLQRLREDILAANLLDATRDADFFAERRGIRSAAAMLREQRGLRRLVQRLRGRNRPVSEV